jgi:sugar transferase EpsL
MIGRTSREMTKKLFDFIFALLGLLLLLPLLLLIAVMVRLWHGSPVIFCQIRPGLYGKEFMMYKFRTMTNERDAEGNLLADEIRLTKLGKFLRCSSLDELPELFNLLRGEMSLVGPRPLLREYLPLYTPEQARRHEVKPGITGLAQISGRNAISWEDRFRLDVWYVDNRSSLLDLRILLMTFAKVFKREGISQDGEATMEAFKGSNIKQEKR